MARVLIRPLDKFDRIYQLHHLFDERRTPISLEDLMVRLACSRSTVFRVIALMKDHLGAPIELIEETGGYRYAPATDGRKYELPGMWFTAHELQALAVLQQLLQGLGPGLLEEHLSPLGRRLGELVQHKRLQLGEAGKRIRILAQATRSAGQCFAIVASATLQRRKLRLQYVSRSKNERTDRIVSPQHIVHYRDNWYLDAWDELRKGLRSFSVDRIHRASQLEEACVDPPAAEMEEHFSSAYGIFSGKANKLAVLRFSRERARWVADERWHPEQSGQFLTDGRYELRIPYRDPRELMMDVLRHGAEVEIVEPEALQAEICRVLKAALEQYASLSARNC